MLATVRVPRPGEKTFPSGPQAGISPCGTKQIALDYPLAWGALGLSGLFWYPVGRLQGWKVPAITTVAILIGAAGRFLFHYLSGIWFFANFAPAGTPVSIYTALYILSHLGPSTLINIVIVGSLYAAGVQRRALPDPKAKGEALRG